MTDYLMCFAIGFATAWVGMQLRVQRLRQEVNEYVRLLSETAEEWKQSEKEWREITRPPS